MTGKMTKTINNRCNEMKIKNNGITEGLFVKRTHNE